MNSTSHNALFRDDVSTDQESDVSDIELQEEVEEEVLPGKKKDAYSKLLGAFSSKPAVAGSMGKLLQARLAEQAERRIVESSEEEDSQDEEDEEEEAFEGDSDLEEELDTDEGMSGASDEEEDLSNGEEDVSDEDGSAFDSEESVDEDEASTAKAERAKKSKSAARVQKDSQDEEDAEESDDEGGEASTNDRCLFHHRFLDHLLDDATSTASATNKLPTELVPAASYLHPASLGAATGGVCGVLLTESRPLPIPHTPDNPTPVAAPVAATHFAPLQHATHGRLDAASGVASAELQALLPVQPRDAVLAPLPLDVTAPPNPLLPHLMHSWGRSYGKELDTIAAGDVPKKKKQGTNECTLTPLQYLLYPYLRAYRDVYLPLRTQSNGRELRTLTCLHVLDHVLKARDAVLEGDNQIREYWVRKKQAELQAAGMDNEGAGAAKLADEEPPECRDQGYTRPRVLILLPFRSSALQYVRSLLRLVPTRDVLNRNRFFKEFTEESSYLGGDYEEDRHAGPPSLEVLAKRTRQMMSDLETDEEEEEYAYNRVRQGWTPKLRERVKAEVTGQKEAQKEEGGSGGDADEGSESRKDEGILESLQRKEEAKLRKERAAREAEKRKATKVPLPRDHRVMFQGNIDDDFRVGISFTRKTVKLFSNFYQSDILIASPLGLRRIIGGEGDRPSERDTDFLSSLELLVIDQAEVLQYQNWQHVLDILAFVNATPKSGKNTDFSRVSPTFLANQGALLRQTLLFSGQDHPQFANVLRKHGKNVSGTVLLRGVYAGVLGRIVSPVRQVFQRVACSSLAQASDAKFKHFETRILPPLMKGLDSSSGQTVTHTAIFAPSYFDYVK